MADLAAVVPPPVNLPAGLTRFACRSTLRVRILARTLHPATVVLTTSVVHGSARDAADSHVHSQSANTTCDLPKRMTPDIGGSALCRHAYLVAFAMVLFNTAPLSLVFNAHISL